MQDHAKDTSFVLRPGFGWYRNKNLQENIPSMIPVEMCYRLAGISGEAGEISRAGNPGYVIHFAK